MRDQSHDERSSGSAYTRRGLLRRTAATGIAASLAGCAALGGGRGGGTERVPSDVTEWPPDHYGDELVARNRFETLTSGDAGFGDEYDVEVRNHGQPWEWNYSDEMGGRTEPPGLADGAVQAVERFVTNTDEGPESVLDNVTPDSEHQVTFATADGLLYDLPTDAMPNWERVPERIRELSYYRRDGGVYAVPVERQLAPLVYNADYFDEPPTSWDVLWEADHEGQIAVSAPPNEFRYNEFQLAAFRTGQDPHDPDDKQALLEPRAELERNETEYVSVWEAVDEFAEEEAIVGQLTLPMIYAARFGRDTPLEYTVPEEGAVATVRYNVVPRAAPNPITGLLFADWALRPDVAVRTCEVGRKPAVDVGDYLAGERQSFFEWSDDWDLVWQTPRHYDAYRDLYQQINWSDIDRVSEA